MARSAIRELKRDMRSAQMTGNALAGQLGRQAALALLDRSIRMRHRRLAVQRLGAAVALGAEISQAQWCYCQAAAAASRDKLVQSLFEAAASACKVQPAGAASSADAYRRSSAPLATHATDARLARAA